jgi:DNA polymerase delta subunit 1
VNLVQKESIYGYSGHRSSPFLHIVTSNPNHVPTAKRALETGFAFGRYEDKIYFSTFESNLPFIMRFMVDTKVTGMNWIELPERKYTVRERHSSKCQIEVDVL